MPNIGDGNISKIQLAVQSSNPATPAAGFVRTFWKGSALRFIDENALVEQSIVASELASKQLVIPVDTTSVWLGNDVGNPSGLNNTLIGEGAGESGTTANENTLIGWNAGNTLVDGRGNSSLGFWSLPKITSGSFNVALGESCLFDLQTGDENIAIGSASLANTTGSDNVAVGSEAGFTNITGQRNVWIGYHAGRSETGDDTLYIANTSTATPLIYGEFAGASAGVTIYGQHISGVPLGVQAIASQSGNVFEARNSSSVAQLSVTPEFGIEAIASTAKHSFGSAIAANVGFKVGGTLDYNAAQAVGVLASPTVESTFNNLVGIQYSPALKPAAASSAVFGLTNLMTLNEASDNTAYDVTTLYPNFYRLTVGATYDATITNLRNVSLQNPVNSTATITNNVGLFVASQTAGTNNWAIQTGTGLNEFGDQLKIDGSQDIEQFISQSHTTQTSDNSQFGDISGGDYTAIDGSGSLYFVGTAGIPGAGISVEDSNTELTISGTLEANKVQIGDFDTNDPSNNMTPDHVENHITCLVAGVYMCEISLSVNSVAGSSAQFGFAAFKNNGATKFSNVHAHRDLVGGAGGNAGSISMSGRITLAVNDTIELWTWNETNTQNIEIDDVTMSLDMKSGA